MPYGGAPTAGSRDEVYFLLGDTDTSAQDFTDAEIDYLISQYGEGLGAAAAGARQLQAKYARRADVTVGDVSESASQLSDHFAALAASLDGQMAARALPTMGGVNVADVERQNADQSQVQPAFKRDQFDNPLADGKSDPFDYTGGL